LVPRNPQPAVLAALKILRIRRAAVRIPGKPGFDPVLVALADHRRLDATVTVDAADEREPLLAQARIPAVRRRVAVQILGLAVAEGRADADDDPVFDVGPQQ